MLLVSCTTQLTAPRPTAPAPTITKPPSGLPRNQRRCERAGLRGFDTGDWLNTVTQMQRVIPGVQFVKLDPSHPIFHSFYDISLDIIQRTYRGIPAYYGIFENNDPKKRLLAILNYNNDIGEYWEFSDEGFDPIAITNEAYKLGVNYLIYALTH